VQQYECFTNHIIHQDDDNLVFVFTHRVRSFIKNWSCKKKGEEEDIKKEGHHRQKHPRICMK